MKKSSYSLIVIITISIILIAYYLFPIFFPILLYYLASYSYAKTNHFIKIYFFFFIKNIVF